MSLRDFAVVDTLELEFTGGMTVVSGETGAGKSLLVTRCCWLTGARADAGIVRHGATRAELAAGFDLGDAPEAAAWLREAELDDDDGACQLRRVIAPTAVRARGSTAAPRRWHKWPSWARTSSRSTAARAPALLARGPQLELLDAFGHHAAALDAVRALAGDWTALERRIAELLRAGDVGERVAFLEHQLGESAARPGTRRDRGPARRAPPQAHASALLSGCEAALERLAGEDGPSLARTLHQVAVDSAGCASTNRAWARSHKGWTPPASSSTKPRAPWPTCATGSTPTRRAWPSSTRDSHAATNVAPVPRAAGAARRAAPGARRRTGVAAWRGRGAGNPAGAARAARAPLARGGRRADGGATSSSRIAGGAVSALMDELGMPGGRFEVLLEAAPTAPNALGAERARIPRQRQPRAAAAPLRKVASGGELARIALAIEVAALGLDPVPTMVLTRSTAHRWRRGGSVGRKLRTLSDRCQVMCVTHLPQVAAQGHHHLRVSKSVTAGRRAARSPRSTTRRASRNWRDAGWRGDHPRIAGQCEADAVAAQDAS